MRATTAIASVLAAAACVSASSSSRHPVLAFTSQQAASLKLDLPADSTVASFIDSLFTKGNTSPACKLDAIVSVPVDKLDSDVFASLKHSSSGSLRARSLGAPAQLTFNDQPDDHIYSDIAKHVADNCGYVRTTIYSMHSNNTFKPKDAANKAFNLGIIRVEDLREEESSLLKALESLDEMFPRNLVILSQNHETAQPKQHTTLTKRQLAAEPSSSNGNWTEPTGGIFAKYQLLSTPLLLTLLLVGGVLLPIVYFAVSQLAQVQTPDQMGVRKDPISGDKKSQ